jgi:glutamine synthetase
MSNTSSVANRLTHGHYLNNDLPQHGKIIAEYIWIDGTGLNLRSKSRTLPGPITDVSELPEWNYDGSSCEQAPTEDSEVIMKPVAFFPDPFRGGDNILVMTATYRWANEEKTELRPANTNFRHFALPVFEAGKEEHPWFGIEQEYTLFECTNAFTKWPLGWPEGGYPPAQGPYYCSVGATTCFGRVIMDNHYKACLAAKINISGTNGEVMPGQWEFQIGPCEGVDIGDHLHVARYLLGRVTEDLNIGLSFDPKPLQGDWNGAGCHTNYSTLSMRNEGGIKSIHEAIDKLEKVHTEHIAMYGADNDKRLTGKHETCTIAQFRSGVGDRGASIRIPTSTNAEGKGYLEDRRPASNIDPYLVGAMLVSTTLLEGKGREEMMEHHQKWLEERAALN